jgi:hypothetical protein
MQRGTPISAPVSKATKELLERHVRATGVKKGHLVEEALQHHLLALQALPSDMILHPRIAISRRSGEKLVARLVPTKRPARKLRELMTGDGD